jgi:transcriptional regulator with XRE-family HTH domain
MDTKLIAGLIKEARLARNLTQEDIEGFIKKWNAEHPDEPLAETSRSRFSQLETVFNNMSLSTLIAICTFLDKEPEELGIYVNLNKKRDKPTTGSKYLVVEPGTPPRLVEAAQEFLRCAKIAYDLEEPARTAMKQTLQEQRDEANNES